MMATVPHVTFGLGLRKSQADGFLLTRVYVCANRYGSAEVRLSKFSHPLAIRFVTESIILFISMLL